MIILTITINTSVIVIVTGGGKNSPPQGFCMLFFKIKDSRHAQLPIDVVFHKESDFKVKNKQFWRPEAKNQEKRTHKILQKIIKQILIHPFKGVPFFFRLPYKTLGLS